MQNKKIYYWLIAPALALVWMVAKVYPVMPAVMQDEYIYSSESRHLSFAEHSFPNYLFSVVYQSTNLCGDNFYGCAKNLNVLFFIAMLFFIFLIAVKLLNPGAAIAVVTITILSPLHVYISYFMPEVMYFAFMSATIWALLHATSKSNILWWSISGAILGLTSLVKPHALFALPAVIAFVLVVSYKRENKKAFEATRNALNAIGAFFVVKFGLGFLFAGTAGLTFFGPGYGNTVNDFLNPAAKDAATETATTGSDVFGLLINTSLLQLMLHISLLLVLWGVPALLSASVIVSVIKKQQAVTELGAFVTLVGTLSITYAVVVAIFEGFVTALGDDHTSRIITRYYDFLMPLLLILSIAVYKYVEPKGWVRALQFGVITGAAIWVGAYFPQNIQSGFSDSVTLVGFMNGWTQLVVELLIFGCLVVWLFKPSAGSKALGWVTVPLVVVIMGISAQNGLMAKVGTEPAYFDIAGQSVKTYLQDVPGDRIGVIGKKRTEVFTAKFWIDKAKIQDRLFGETQELSVYMLQNLDYALILGASEVEGAGEIVTSGENYVLVKVDEKLFMDE